MTNVRLSLAFALVLICSVEASGQGITADWAREELDKRGFVRDGALLQEDFIEQCVLGNIENVKLFLLAGADPNATAHDGRPPLIALVDQNYTEVHGGHVSVLETIIGAGANIEVRDKIGRTAFVIATLRQNHALLSVLLQTKGDR